MEAQQLQLNTISNNLANANTIGFKRAKIEFQDMLYQSQRDAGAQTGEGRNDGHAAGVVEVEFRYQFAARWSVLTFAGVGFVDEIDEFSDAQPHPAIQ